MSIFVGWAFFDFPDDPDDYWIKISHPIFHEGILEIESMWSVRINEGQRAKGSFPMEINDTEQSGVGLLFFFIHNCPLKWTERRNSLFLRASLKIMTQYEVITELIIHLKESAAIFWFSDTKTSICETDITRWHLPYRYIYTPTALMP